MSKVYNTKLWTLVLVVLALSLCGILLMLSSSKAGAASECDAIADWTSILVNGSRYPICGEDLNTIQIEDQLRIEALNRPVFDELDNTRNSLWWDASFRHLFVFVGAWTGVSESELDSIMINEGMYFWYKHPDVDSYDVLWYEDTGPTPVLFIPGIIQE